MYYAFVSYSNVLRLYLLYQCTTPLSLIVMYYAFVSYSYVLRLCLL